MANRADLYSIPDRRAHEGPEHFQPKFRPHEAKDAKAESGKEMAAEGLPAPGERLLLINFPSSLGVHRCPAFELRNLRFSEQPRSSVVE